MILGSAKRISSTSAKHTARILTASIDASHGVGAGIVGSAGVDAFAALADGSRAAIRVVQTAGRDNSGAFDVGVASVAGSARAMRSMGDGSTLRVLTTGFGEVAWGKTLSVNASLVVWAVLVKSAAADAFFAFANATDRTVIICCAFRWR